MFDTDSTDELKQVPPDTIRSIFPAEIGGGDGYDPTTFKPYTEWATVDRVTKDDADEIVTDFDGLLSAIDTGNDSSGEYTIYLDTEEINTRERSYSRIKIHDDITIASGQGVPGEPMCTIKIGKPHAFFWVEGDRNRFTGFELESDETEYFDPRDRYPEAGGDAIYKMETIGILIYGDETEVDNMRIRGFTSAGVLIQRTQSKVDEPDYKTLLHHNEFVDCPADTLGYGVNVDEGGPIITSNWFDNCRHMLAASGGPNCHYVAKYNVFGPNIYSHVVDMHGHEPGDREYMPLDERIPDPDLRRLRQNADTDGVHHAGGRVAVFNNAILNGDQTGLKIRGCPRLGGLFIRNFVLNYEGDVPTGLGQLGRAWLIRAGNMSLEETGMQIKDNLIARDPTSSVGPGLVPAHPSPPADNTEVKQLKEKVATLETTVTQLEEQNKQLKPKAEAAENASDAFKQLTSLL